MARTKAFDTDQALKRALHLFWKQGYEHTSMQDLVEAMGINRGSLYDTFGDKHSLYVMAVEKYLSDYSMRDVRQAMAEGEVDPKTVIAALLRRMAREAAGKERARGCFLTNTIVEIGRADGAIAARARSAIEDMERILTDLIAEGQKRGQFTNHRDAPALALFLVNTMQGLRVLSKIYEDGDRLDEVVDGALDALAA